MMMSNSSNVTTILHTYISYVTHATVIVLAAHFQFNKRP